MVLFDIDHKQSIKKQKENAISCILFLNKVGKHKRFEMIPCTKLNNIKLKEVS